MAFLDTDHEVAEGRELTIDVRGRHLAAHVVALPFIPVGKARAASEGAS
jgi:hypothetical protein